ncbi:MULTISPECIES: polyhydroxyalkanoic acid system family protein [unclassified Luteibacter]|uniref:polyhydroxyalkanoic acid system family protein n=1 Tax=unclassified Luteibacter TaxID=2620188 RepID=UPI0008C090AD|nr:MULTISPECIES: polyhydroxyalkanoic acid system family protein [unclassified Luteibacter]MDR6935066.1 putative polyhydroxyalkanoate system protein [Luteibacter sp. 3190]SEO81240.1 putative polyhydroxyalkanoic acid system protein [Luteibacter sp. UNC138MFCol5.1]
MAKIDIRRPHGKTVAEARAVVDAVASRMNEKLGTEGGWQGDTYLFARSGVKGAIAVSAADVHVTAELGMLLTPMKGMIENEIRQKLDEKFA